MRTPGADFMMMYNSRKGYLRNEIALNSAISLQCICRSSQLYLTPRLDEATTTSLLFSAIDAPIISDDTDRWAA